MKQWIKTLQHPKVRNYNIITFYNWSQNICQRNLSIYLKSLAGQNNNSRTQLSFVLHNKSSLSFLFRSMWPANTHLITRRKYTRKEWRCYVIIKQLIDAAIACKCKGSLNKVHFPIRRWSKKISWQRWIFLIFYICVFISYINNYYN